MVVGPRAEVRKKTAGQNKSVIYTRAYYNSSLQRTVGPVYANIYFVVSLEDARSAVFKQVMTVFTSGVSQNLVS